MTRNRDDIVAAAFAAAGPKLEFDPLRAQKLLFLIDQVVSGRIGGPFFNFRPYLYDPFDRVVYDAIQNLVAAAYAQTDTAGPYQRHVLTNIGYRHGVTVLGSLPNPVADYFGRTAMWVLLVPYRPADARGHLSRVPGDGVEQRGPRLGEFTRTRRASIRSGSGQRIRPHGDDEPAVRFCRRLPIRRRCDPQRLARRERGS